MNRHLKVILDVIKVVGVFLLITFIGAMIYKKVHIIFDTYSVICISILYIVSEIYFKNKQKFILFVGAGLFALVQYPFLDDMYLVWKVYLSVLPFIYSSVVLLLIKYRDSKIVGV